MRVLFDITHPAQVHFFKHLIWLLQQRGDQVLVATRRKDVTLDLLDRLAIPYECLSAKGWGMLGMASELLERYIKLLRLARRFSPDVMMAQTGVSIGLVGALLGVPRLVLEEAEHARLQQVLGLPFATSIFTGTGYTKSYGPREVKFRGIWVQSYLHPNYFTPNRRPLIEAGVDPDRPFIVLRTVSWSAAHDVGLHGAGEAELRGIVERLSRYGRVLISSEGELPSSLVPYRNPVPVEHVHDLLAAATLYIGEGGTMAAEAAVLGTPAVFCNHLRVGYLSALEHQYGLAFNTDSLRLGLPIAERLLGQADLRNEWRSRVDRLMLQSDDVTRFMLDLVDRTVGRGARGCVSEPSGARADRPLGARADKPLGARADKPPVAQMGKPLGARADKPPVAQMGKPPVARIGKPPVAHTPSRDRSADLVVIPVVAGIGNALMTVPMVRQLKRGRPSARICIVARTRAMGDIFRRLNEVDEVMVVGDEVLRWLGAMLRVRSRRPSVCLVPFPSNRWEYTAVAVTCGAARHLQHRYPVGRWRTGAFMPADRLDAVRGIHDVRQNLLLLGELGIEPDFTEAPRFPVLPGDRQRAAQLLGEAGVGEGARAVAVHAGSARTVLARAKRWPGEHYATLLAAIQRDLRLPVVMLEGPDETGVGERILARLPGTAARVIRLVDGLGDAAGVLERCRLYVGSDSGLAHLAAAVGTPAVTLFAPADPDRVCPFGQRDLVVQPEGRACSPCFAYPWKSPYPRIACDDPVCIADITPRSVLAAVAKALNKEDAAACSGKQECSPS
jgi:predicted glycosyltransferase